MSKFVKVESWKELKNVLSQTQPNAKLYFITHAGVFHADDAAATALMKHVMERLRDRPGYIEPEFFRVGNLQNFIADITADGNDDRTVYGLIYDVGYGSFDHHQDNPRVRNSDHHNVASKTSGIPYAAFGLLWQEFGHIISEDEGWRCWIDTVIVSPIDYQDNGRGSNPLSLLISAYNPNWDGIDWGGCEGDGQDERFWLAVDVMYNLLGAIFYRHYSEVRARETIKISADNNVNGVVILDRYIPTNSIAERDDVKCIVAPSNREDGAWNIIIPGEVGTKTSKKCLTEDYIFERDRPEGCTFVHKSLNLATFKNKALALEAALVFARTAYK